MNADDFLDTPSADDFLGGDTATIPKPKRQPIGRGNSYRPAPATESVLQLPAAPATESVLQLPGQEQAFADAPDPRANATALFNALTNNPELAKSPMYGAGAAVLEQAAGVPSAVQSASRRNQLQQAARQERERQILAARENTDQAFGGPLTQAMAAPGRRLASGVAQVVGGVASIPQLVGSNVGRDTAEAANVMARANMPEDPGLADEVLAGAGQLLPMIGGATALRGALMPFMGEGAATRVATGLSGAASGAMTGGEVLRGLEDRIDLSDEDKRQRAGLAALFSAVTGKYADRFLIPGADKAATGALQAGGRAFVAGGTQEGLDEMGQNVATDQPAMQGVPRAALIGGIVGGGARTASEVSGAPFQLAQAIEADAQALANQPTPPSVWAPTEARVGAPLPPPAPAPQPAPPALPYDPSVTPSIMLAGQDGTARPMTADEFLEAEDSRQEIAAREQSDAEVGLTPDVRRAQEMRTEPTGEPAAETPDLVRRLMAAGWTPPENTNASTTGGSTSSFAPAAQADPLAAPDRAPAANNPATVGAAGADGLRAGVADAALNPAANNEALQQRAQMSFAGRRAATADQAAREAAQGRLAGGDDAEAVRKETGWHRGVDGEMRFEVDDSAARLRGEGSFGDVVMERYRAKQPGDRVLLEDVLEHPALFAAYPDLKTVEVQFTPKDVTAAGRLGSDGVLQVRDSLPAGDALSTILHEVQHAIQTREGFASGGSIASYDAPASAQEVGREMAQLEKVLEDADKYGIDYMSYAEKPPRWLTPGAVGHLKRWGRDRKILEGNIRAFKEQALEPTDRYRRQAGEVEARNTQARQAMTADERREIPPKDTADVPPDDQLVNRDAGPQDRADPLPRRAPETSTAATIRTELRERFGNVTDRLEKRGFLKLWDSTADYTRNAGQGSFRLPDDAAGVQGLYSGGVAHLFGDGIEPGKAVAVLLHEVGEHASMKAMLGDRYKDLVRRAYQLVSEGNEIAETALERIPPDTAAKFQDSELLAYMIEEVASRPDATPAVRKWLADVVAAVRAWFFQTPFAKQLERYGVRLELTPQDIAALAVRAVRWQAEQGGEQAQRGTNAAMASRKPVAGNNQDGRPAGDSISGTDEATGLPLNADGTVTASQNVFGTNTGTGAAPAQPAQNLGAQPWTVAEPGTWDNIVRQMQNSKVDLKRVRDAIEQRFGRLPSDRDGYLQEELYHGKVAARVEKLHREQVEPILRKIAVAEKNVAVTLDDVNSYLHARHAPERNSAMAAINPTMANNQALSGMSDADAAHVLREFQRNGKATALTTIAKDIDQLLADTRTALVADGLEEAGVVQSWEQAYKHYVPLMRDIEDRPAKGSGISVRGREAKRAVGSNKAVVNILANVVTQAETAAIRAEKAEVGRAVLEMAQQYPNPDFWTVDTPPTKPRINPQTGLVERNAVDPLYQTADNVVMVKEYGAVRFIVFNKGNERAAQTARALKNLDIQQVPAVIRYVGMGTRFMASLLTQRNPEFWFTNLARDLQGSAIQMNGTDAEGLQAKVMGYLPKALAGMRHVARETGKNTQWARYAQELKDAGGTTGYMQMFENSDARMKNLQREVDRMGQGKADPRRLVRQMVEFIDDYNDVIENGMRLAVFQAARETGVSTDRAASLAKNITVNFNRKGNAAPVVNSLYMFFNAGIQGTARLSQALVTSGKARTVVGGLAGLAFVMDIVNRAIAGEDDETKRNRYDLINEFEKSRNWIFMLPDGNYVKVPLPLGFHVFHNAGRLIADGLNRKDPRNAAEYGWAFASTVVDAFNPVGSFASVGQLLAPSVTDPVVQLAENKNFMGGKVFRSDDVGFGKTDPRPAYQRHFETTPDFWKAASKTLNDITGGDTVKPGAVNIEPDIMRHVWGAITGGPGRALDKTVDTVQAKGRGQEVTPARVPFVHRFAGSITDRQRDSAYYEDLKRAGKAKDLFDYYVKNGRRQDALAVLEELGEGDVTRGRRFILEYNLAKKDERLINRRLRQLQEADADEEALQTQTQALKQRRATNRHRVLKSTGEDDSEE